MNLPTLDEIDRELARRSLAEFVRQAWPTIEGSTPLVWNWHLDIICDEVESWIRGKNSEQNLNINVPPGSMKSTIVSVCLPAWIWLWWPEWAGLFLSGAEDVSMRDSMKCRQLITSDWYAGFNVPWRLAPDQDAKRWFRNTVGGERQASTIGAKGTGKRVHHVVVDDANDTKDVSDLKLKAVWDSWRLTFQNRLKSMVTGGRCNIQQRTHMKDLSGMLTQEDGEAWRRVVIRQEFEPGDPEAHPNDPRTMRGELFFAQRFPASAVESERRLLQNGYSGQHQQRPVADGGDILKPDRWVLVDAIPAGTVFVRGWDLAASDGRGDWTVGAKVGRCPDGRFIVADIIRLQKGPEGVRKAIKDAADADGRAVTISIPQDPGQAGKGQALDFVRMLAGWIAKTSPESGDKVVRANPFAAQTNVGNVMILRAAWNSTLISEASAFPLGMHDDQVDAIARAFNELMSVGSPLPDDLKIPKRW